MKCPECGRDFPAIPQPGSPSVLHYIVCAGCTEVCILVGYGAGLTVRPTTEDEFDHFISHHGFRQAYFVACLTADATERT